MKWEFEADYYTFCNCDWGCPCNFNARPTQGHCHGGGVYRIKTGHFGKVKLYGVKFALMYWFPARVQDGNGIGRAYVDDRATPEQRDAVDAIASGTAGGGIFELFRTLTREWYPTLVTRIDFEVKDGEAALKVGDVLAAESALLNYPDGSVIRPTFTLPDGIEFKTGLATNTRKWWV